MCCFWKIKIDDDMSIIGFNLWRKSVTRKNFYCEKNYGLEYQDEKGVKVKNEIVKDFKRLSVGSEKWENFQRFCEQIIQVERKFVKKS